MRELNEERQSWESVKREEIEGIVEEEKNKWRNTGTFCISGLEKNKILLNLQYLSQIFF